MLIDPVLVALPICRVAQVDWSSSGRSDDHFAYDIATGTVQDHPAEKIPPVKRQKIDDRPFVPVMAPAVDVDDLPGVSRKTVSEVQRDYRRYPGIIGDVSRQPAAVPVDMVDDPDDAFAQEALWEGYCLTARGKTREIARASGK